MMCEKYAIEEKLAFIELLLDYIEELMDECPYDAHSSVHSEYRDGWNTALTDVESYVLDCKSWEEEQYKEVQKGEPE